MYHIEFSAEKTRRWLSENVYLVLALFWMVLTFAVMALWDHHAPLLVMMGLYIIVAGALIASRLVSDMRETSEALVNLESREGMNEGDIRLLVTSFRKLQEEVMAIGKETKAALEELRDAIAAEADQAAEKIIAHLQADEATAEAIRDAVQDVKNIIPDDVEDTDVPTVQDPDEGDEGGVDPDDAA